MVAGEKIFMPGPHPPLSLNIALSASNVFLLSPCINIIFCHLTIILLDVGDRRFYIIVK